MRLDKKKTLFYYFIKINNPTDYTIFFVPPANTEPVPVNSETKNKLILNLVSNKAKITFIKPSKFIEKVEVNKFHEKITDDTKKEIEKIEKLTEEEIDTINTKVKNEVAEITNKANKKIDTIKNDTNKKG